MSNYRSRYTRRTRSGRRRRYQVMTGIGLLCIAAGVATAAILHPSAVSNSTSEGAPPVTAALFGPGAAPTTSATAFETAMKVASDGRQQLIVGPLTSGDAAASVRLTADGSYDIERDQNLKDKQDTARKRFKELATAVPSGTAVDGLYALEQHLVSLPHSTTNVLLVGNVLKVTREVDLNDPVQRGDIKESLTKVAASHLMDHCESWRVHIVAGTATDGKVRDSRLDLQAREFWRRLVTKCGGQLTLWDTTQLLAFPSLTAVPAAAIEACQVQFTFAGGVLFAGDRWDLQPSALPTLQELRINLTTTHPDARVVIDGYTADTGAQGIDNYQLSRLRATAVRQWLIDHGVATARITATGHGPEHPVASNATAAGQQLNRRVEIRLQLSPAECANRQG